MSQVLASTNVFKSWNTSTKPVAHFPLKYLKPFWRAKTKAVGYLYQLASSIQ